MGRDLTDSFYLQIVLQLFGLKGYTPDQLDEGKSVQGGIECVTVCHLNCSNLSLDLCTYIISFNL